MTCFWSEIHGVVQIILEHGVILIPTGQMPLYLKFLMVLTPGHPHQLMDFSLHQRHLSLTALIILLSTILEIIN